MATSALSANILKFGQKPFCHIGRCFGDRKLWPDRGQVFGPNTCFFALRMKPAKPISATKASPGRPAAIPPRGAKSEHAKTGFPQRDSP